MSDNWFVVIPSDPEFRPNKDATSKAKQVFCAIAPLAEEIAVEHDADPIRFFDCGGNFSRTLCPGCGAEIATDTWHRFMDTDFDATTRGFTLNRHETPCCQTQVTVNDLTYDWPQGFARFGFSAMNPDRDPLNPDEVARLETALGCPIRVIYRHI